MAREYNYRLCDWDEENDRRKGELMAHYFHTKDLESYNMEQARNNAKENGGGSTGGGAAPTSRLGGLHGHRAAFYGQMGVETG